jgi:hypothetical protein
MLNSEQENRFLRATVAQKDLEIDVLAVENKRLDIELQLLKLKKTPVLINNG